MDRGKTTKRINPPSAMIATQGLGERNPSPRAPEAACKCAAAVQH